MAASIERTHSRCKYTVLKNKGPIDPFPLNLTHWPFNWSLCNDVMFLYFQLLGWSRAQSLRLRTTALDKETDSWSEMLCSFHVNKATLCRYEYSLLHILFVCILFVLHYTFKPEEPEDSNFKLQVNAKRLPAMCLKSWKAAQRLWCAAIHPFFCPLALANQELFNLRIRGKPRSQVVFPGLMLNTQLLCGFAQLVHNVCLCCGPPDVCVAHCTALMKVCLWSCLMCSSTVWLLHNLTVIAILLFSR